MPLDIDRETLSAVVAVASSRRAALVQLGVANPGPSSYAQLVAACKRFDLAVPAAISPDADRTEKPCGTCKQVLPIASFALRDLKSGRHQGSCRDCHSSARRGHYERNTTKIKNQVSVRKKEVRLRNMTMLVAYLVEHPCVDCGETDVLVLEFDHVTGVKVKNVTSLVHLADFAQIEAEIAKCVVRCANCHKRKTSAQFGWMRAALAQTVGHLPSKQE